MNYAEVKPVDIANGPGVRVSLFVSGCNHHCKGCFNQVAWDFQYGVPFTQKTIDHLIELLSPDYITGLTLLGGEPFDPRNQDALIDLLHQVREKLPGKTIWGFTGYVFPDIPGRAMEMLEMIDVLVDGPFIEEQKNISLQFRGSENQRIIDVKRSLEEGRVVLWPCQ